MENLEKVDWTTLQIVETRDDEGQIELMSESQMRELLGMADEGTHRIYLHKNLIIEWMNKAMSLVKMLMMLPFLLMMSYRVRSSFHMIRTTHQ